MFSNCNWPYGFGCVCCPDALFWEKTSLFPVPCLSSELVGCSFHWFYDALHGYSASPVGLDRFDPFYSSWKGFHDAGFQEAVAETAC